MASSITPVNNSKDGNMNDDSNNASNNNHDADLLLLIIVFLGMFIVCALKFNYDIIKYMKNGRKKKSGINNCRLVNIMSISNLDD